MWTQFLENPKALSPFDTPPSLERVRVTSITLHEDGPTISVGLALDEFPASPPARWAPRGANAVVMHLQLMAAEDLSIAGWTNENFAAILLGRAPTGKIHFEATGPLLKVRCTCGCVRVEKLSPYRRDLRRECV